MRCGGGFVPYSHSRMLTSLQNPLVKQLRQLHRPKGRRQHQCFLLEGTHLLEVALTTPHPLQVLCYTPTWQEHHGPLWQAAVARSRQAICVSPELMRAIATTVHPDGVVATMVRGIVHGQPPIPCQLGLALETLQDPGNLGTIIRTTVAAGADGLWLSPDSVDLDHPKVLRASAGQWFQLSMGVRNLAATVSDCREQGMQVITTHLDTTLTPWDLDLTLPTLLVLGNEGAGLSPALLALGDQAVKIPLSPGVESLNVAIAAALLLYEARRQRVGL